MCTLYLIRHGATDSAGHVLTGRAPGIHLSERGSKQAAQLPHRFANVPIAAIYATPLERTQETAAPLAQELGLSVEISEDLTEVDYGEWMGRAVKDLLQDALWNRFNAFRSSTGIPGGESMLQIQTRVVGCLNRIRDSFPDQHIAIVSHGDPIKAAVSHYIGLHLDMFFRFQISPASVTIVRVSSTDAAVIALNILDVGFAEYLTS